MYIIADINKTGGHLGLHGLGYNVHSTASQRLHLNIIDHK
jgi:hypothetical protein